MEVTIKAESDVEALRILKSLDMAFFIFDLKQLLFKHSEKEDIEDIAQSIQELLEKHDIDIYKLIE